MKCYPQSVHDQVAHDDYWFGIDLEEDGGIHKQEALDYIDKHQEYRGGERLEYYGNEMEIQFLWDMTEDDYARYMENARHPKFNADNYCGGVFFGNLKMEFVMTEDTNYHNVFLWGKHGYDFLEDGTPYDELFMDDVVDSPRRTFEGFARSIEAQIIKSLNENPETIPEALGKTNPEKWYPGPKYNYMKKITRRA